MINYETSNIILYSNKKLKNMKSKVLLLVLLLFGFEMFSQTFDLNGTVLDGSGLSVPGVNVKVKSSVQSTVTDFDGSFKLSGLTNKSVIVLSYIGYKTQEILVSGPTMKITMEEDAKSLDEVVVIGYGSQKKREVTGAVAVVDSKTLEVLKPIKVEQALHGTISGVNVTSQSGAPGAGLDIRIRGIATNGENRPTAIIDGYVGDLSLLNPNDIETITVLKDAQAAIYGTIGANGVILVTTKMGRKNSKPKIVYNTYSGFQESSRKLKTLNATEYALLLNESYANGGRPVPYPNVSGLGEGTNWQNEVFGRGVPLINHDLSISGGSETVTYAVSGSHLGQEGIVGGDKSGFLRNTARIALGADITDKLKIKTNVIYTYFNRKTLNENGLGSVLFNALNVPATISPYQPNGDFTLVSNASGFGNEIINPLAQIENTFNDYNYKKINGNFGMDYKIFKGFVLSGAIGFNTSNSEGRNFAKQISYGGKVFDVVQSSVTQSTVNDNDYSFDLFGTYTNTAGENHNISGTVGTTIFKQYGNGLSATGYDVPYNSWEFADLDLITTISKVRNNSSYTYDQRRLSYFARAQYDYKGKYLLSAMIRRDASTKFGPGNKVGYFPSVTAGWVVSDEGFFKQSNTFNFLKFRASYGTLGNDQIPNYGYLGILNGEATYVFGDLTGGRAQGQLPNPNIKWEEARKFDVGADLRLFNDKISLVADYFIDTRKDLLIPNIPVSGINGTGAPGASAPTVNAGTVRNSGFEFAIDYKERLSDSFSMNVGYNVSFIKNEVLEVNNGTGFIERGAFSVGQQAPTRMEVGKAIGYFYGYKTDGIFQNQAEVDAHPSQQALGANAAPGDLRFVDVNGDGVIDSNDRTNIGDQIPAATMGFNIQMNYKNLDFGVYTFASLGNDLIRNYERNLTDVNHLNYVLDRWTGEGTSNSTPRVTTGATANSVFSDYYVEDASYWRIQNVQIGYTINSNITQRAGITKLRLYAGANNLYTFTKYRGFDPGASTGDPIAGGIDYGFYPIPRTYLLGLNLNF
jgi:TonB-linked SusC/RagA family outer membrane protein